MGINYSSFVNILGHIIHMLLVVFLPLGPIVGYKKMGNLQEVQINIASNI